MGWNVGIAVGAAVAQFITAWLGWRVTQTDPSLTKRQKHIYDIVFIAVGLIGVMFVAIAAYRGQREERAHLLLREDLAYSFGNTEATWAKVNDFLPIGEPMKLNIDFKNVGDGPATNATHVGRVYIEADESLASSRDAVSKFQTWFKITNPSLTETTIAKDQEGFVTNEGDILTPEDSQNITLGRRVIYEVGTFWFDDDRGAHHHNFCWLLHPPAIGGRIITEACREFTDEQ